MRVIAWDTETALIRPALLAPQLACLTYQELDSYGRVHDAEIADSAQAGPLLRAWLEDQNCLLVGHNVAYDAGVVCEAFPDLRSLFFAAYDANRVTCTQIRQQLLDIASGVYRGRHVGKGVYVKPKYDLKELAHRLAGIELQKDAWRMSYGEFIGVPLEQWPARAVAVQAKAKARLEELQLAVRDGRLDGTSKALADEIQGLVEMVASDPNRCTTYPLDDARATLAVYLAQTQHETWLSDQFRQVQAALSLHLSSAHGLRTDAEGVDVLRREVSDQLEEVTEHLIEMKIVRENGTRDTKAAKRRMIDVCIAEKMSIPRTDGHNAEGKCKKLDGTPVPDGNEACEEHVCLDADACERSEDDVLMAYAELSTLKKVLSNDVEALAKAVMWPIHTRYGLAETGRTTSSKPNIQNWVRSRKCKPCNGKEGNTTCPKCHGTGMLAGARECFVPRLGWVYAQADFPQLELYTLAQCCKTWLGQSKLAEALNAGLDPHLQVASLILNISYDEAKKRKNEDAVKEARGAGKVANFGFPGGLGIVSLVAYAKKAYGVTLTEAQAKKLKEFWFAAWPEMPFYFSRVNALCDNVSGRAVVETLHTKRFRGNASYCAACNNGFQALGADCAKRAAWLIAKAEYVDEKSPLYNGRTVAFVHDEFIAEVRDDARAHDAAYELARLMVEGANAYLPDVPIPVTKMEPLLMRRWSKKAEPTFVDGRLVPWGEAPKAKPILTNAQGVPFAPPSRSGFATDADYVRACHEHNDAVTGAANAAFDGAFRP